MGVQKCGSAVSSACADFSGRAQIRGGAAAEPDGEACVTGADSAPAWVGRNGALVCKKVSGTVFRNRFQATLK